MRLVIHKHLVIDKDRPLVFLVMNGVYGADFWGGGDYVLKSLSVPLVRMLLKHRAQVVMVSSRFNHQVDASHAQVSEFREMFGLTPLGSLDTQGGEARGRAVAECIEDTGHRQAIVIDDCDHFYRDERIPVGRIVAPSGRYGMQAKDMELLSNLLTA